MCLRSDAEREPTTVHLSGNLPSERSCRPGPAYSQYYAKDPEKGHEKAPVWLSARHELIGKGIKPSGGAGTMHVWR